MNDVTKLIDTRNRRKMLQQDYCGRMGYPIFLEADLCHHCFSCAYDYLTDEQCAKEHITGCPVCHRTFCD